MRHVKHQLAAYAEGLLNPEQEMQVRDHLVSCHECRNILTQHEQVIHDLRLTLTTSPRQSQIAQWWYAIQTTQVAVPSVNHSRLWASTAMLPTMLAVFLIVLPMLIGFAGRADRAALVTGTYLAPKVAVTNLPPTDQGYQTQEAPELETAAASMLYYQGDATAVPMIPAPLAP